MLGVTNSMTQRLSFPAGPQYDRALPVSVLSIRVLDDVCFLAAMVEVRHLGLVRQIGQCVSKAGCPATFLGPFDGTQRQRPSKVCACKAVVCEMIAQQFNTRMAPAISW